MSLMTAACGNQTFSEFLPWKILSMSNLLMSTVLRYCKRDKEWWTSFKHSDFLDILVSRISLIFLSVPPNQTVQWYLHRSHWRAGISRQDEDRGVLKEHWLKCVWQNLRTHKMLCIPWTCCMIAPKQFPTLHPIKRSHAEATTTTYVRLWMNTDLHMVSWVLDCLLSIIEQLYPWNAHCLEIIINTMSSTM